MKKSTYIFFIILLLLLISGCSQYEKSDRIQYPSSIGGNDVQSIEVYTADSEKFIVEYVNSPERQLISKVIDRATLIENINNVEFDYIIKVNYIDKSAENYWFKLNSSKLKNGEDTYSIREIYTGKLNDFLLTLQNLK